MVTGVYKNDKLLNVITENISRLNQLERHLPEGLVVDAAWLERLGISSSLRAYYVRTRWLEQPTRGLYRRTRGELQWQQVAISLRQMLDKPIHVGGRSALDAQGFAHYLSVDPHRIHLYGPEKPPSWLAKLELPQTFEFHNTQKLFPTSLLGKDDVREISWGQWDWTLTVSTPERAFLELLDQLPDEESFHQVDMLMQGASHLSPTRLEKLLTTCTSVKVKRLFFFFADRHQHDWRNRLDRGVFDLGSGKRMLVRGGRLDPEYLITVPESLDALS
ncbi:AbiEi antitoxin [Pontimonas salivibrio]|uniref:AbiEi antitoxin n=1 Tax=Pontimonas salivibrio TaxID=1159327 RepID=A0A2L2BP10_9MICO|nr:AbiEi antitoxin [Pontimonas salivibrio]